MIQPTDTVLFQGDSITDGGRVRADKPANDPESLGHSYARLAAASLLVDHPGVKCFNRGISGNRIGDLTDRWDTDCLELTPTVVSILIGVNDTWHGRRQLQPRRRHPARPLRPRLPRAASTHPRRPARREARPVPAVRPRMRGRHRPELPPRHRRATQARRRRWRLDHADVYVRFQDMFDEAVKRAEPEYWARDGVHPQPGWPHPHGPRVGRGGGGEVIHRWTG